MKALYQRVVADLLQLRLKGELNAVESAMERVMSASARLNCALAAEDFRVPAVVDVLQTPQQDRNFGLQCWVGTLGLNVEKGERRRSGAARETATSRLA